MTEADGVHLHRGRKSQLWHSAPGQFFQNKTPCADSGSPTQHSQTHSGVHILLATRSRRTAVHVDFSVQIPTKDTFDEVFAVCFSFSLILDV